MKKTNLMSILLIVSSMVVLAHQEITTTKGWFEVEQFLHHENIAAVLFAFAVGMLVTHQINRTGCARAC